LYWKNGKRYKGEFLEDLMHGNGTMIWKDKTKYVG